MIPWLPPYPFPFPPSLTCDTGGSTYMCSWVFFWLCWWKNSFLVVVLLHREPILAIENTFWVYYESCHAYLCGIPTYYVDGQNHFWDWHSFIENTFLILRTSSGYFFYGSGYVSYGRAHSWIGPSFVLVGRVQLLWPGAEIILRVHTFDVWCICVLMCVYIYVYIYVCIYIYTHVCIYLYIYTYIHICIFTFTPTWCVIHMCVHAHVQTYIFVCESLCVYVQPRWRWRYHFDVCVKY